MKIKGEFKTSKNVLLPLHVHSSVHTVISSAVDAAKQTKSRQARHELTFVIVVMGGHDVELNRVNK